MIANIFESGFGSNTNKKQARVGQEKNYLTIAVPLLGTTSPISVVVA